MMKKITDALAVALRYTVRMILACSKGPIAWFLFGYIFVVVEGPNGWDAFWSDYLRGSCTFFAWKGALTALINVFGHKTISSLRNPEESSGYFKLSEFYPKYYAENRTMYYTDMVKSGVLGFRAKKIHFPFDYMS